MNVTLPSELDLHLQQKGQAGFYRTTDQAVSAELQLCEQERDWNWDNPELKSLLLQAVEGAHRPLRQIELEAMEQRVLAGGDLVFERTMHGSRDLPRRLMEPPR